MGFHSMRLHYWKKASREKGPKKQSPLHSESVITMKES